jgi:hypothetical protein
MMPLKNFDTKILQLFCDAIATKIRARNRKSLLSQNMGDRGHADAANTDKMKRPTAEINWIQHLYFLPTK